MIDDLYPKVSVLKSFSIIFWWSNPFRVLVLDFDHPCIQLNSGII